MTVETVNGGEPVAGLGQRLVLGFAAQGTQALILVVTTPLFLSLLGPDSFGLVTFSTVLQAWMLLFDLGVSAVLARQLSRFHAGALEPSEAKGLFVLAEWVFLAGGILAFWVFAADSRWIATHWLGATRLHPDEVRTCLVVIGALLVLRWMSGMYQTALAGLERQSSVYLVAIAAAGARNLAIVAVLFLWSRSPLVFFVVNAAWLFLEVASYRLLLARALPQTIGRLQAGWRLLRQEYRFALGLVSAALVGTAIYQADRLALSHSLSLGEYGLFGLVASVCAGIAMIIPPFVQAFQPRLTVLLARGQRADFVHVYRLSVALTFAIAAGAAGAIAAEPEWTLFAWTGNAAVAHHLAPVLSLYAAAAGVAAYLYTPWTLQYAAGRVRMWVIGYCLFAVIWVPASVWAAWTYGPMGTGVVGVVGNALFLVLWVPLVHKELLTPSERRGIDMGIWIRAALVAALLALVRAAPIPAPGRLEALGLLGVLAAGVSLIAAASLAESRDFLCGLVAGSWRGKDPST